MNEARMRSVVRNVDRVAEWSGEVFCWMIIPLVFAMVYEVIARYAFHAATVWSFDVAYMLYGSHFMLGAAYTLLRGGHIRTDIFYMNWSPRTKGIVDASLYLFLFFPGMALFFWMGWQEALHSWDIREVSDASPWRPPRVLQALTIGYGLALFDEGHAERSVAAGLAATAEELQAAARRWLMPECGVIGWALPAKRRRRG